MAALNANAPIFIPYNATTTTTEEVSLLYTPLRSLPPQIFSSCNAKGTVFLHPSLVYYYQLSPSHLSFFPNISYYIPPPKYSLPAIVESAATGDLSGRVEEERFSMEVKAPEEDGMRTVTSSRFAIRGLRGQHGGRQFMRRSSQQWVRKSSSGVKSPEDVAFPMVEDSQFCNVEKSTVMIKNIPNKLSRRQIIDMLDQHCLIENKKIKDEGAEAPFSEFDFLYLPMDFISGNNLGYAFVNFTNPASAKRLYQHFHLMTWNSFGSRKTCQITHAKIQGSEELVKHFKRSIFTCSSADYLPVFFQPSRDGFRNSDEQLVGKLVQRSFS